MGLISRVSSRTYRFSVYSYKQRKMRSELCQFSGLKIFPGHGKTFVKADGKRVHLINGKSEVLYRRKNKKGTMTEIDAKKRKRRIVKTVRGAGSQSWAEIQAKKEEQAAKKKATGAAAKKAPAQKAN